MSKEVLEISWTAARDRAECAAPDQKGLAELYLEVLSYYRINQDVPQCSELRARTSNWTCCPMHLVLRGVTQELHRKAEELSCRATSGMPGSEMWWKAHGFELPYGCRVVD